MNIQFLTNAEGKFLDGNTSDGGVSTTNFFYLAISYKYNLLK